MCDGDDDQVEILLQNLLWICAVGYDRAASHTVPINSVSQRSSKQWVNVSLSAAESELSVTDGKMWEGGSSDIVQPSDEWVGGVVLSWHSNQHAFIYGQKFIIKPEKSDFSCWRKFEPELRDAVFYFESLFPFRVGAIKLCFCTWTLSLLRWKQSSAGCSAIHFNSASFILSSFTFIYIYINHNINTVR